MKYDISIGLYSTLRHVLTQDKTGTIIVANDTDSSISGSSGSIACSSSSISSISDTKMRLAVALSTAQRSMAKVCNLHTHACAVRRFLTMHFDLYFYDGSCALKMSKKDVSYLLNLKKGCRLSERRV